LATKSVEGQLAEVQAQNKLIKVQLAEFKAQLADSKIQHALVKERANQVEARLVKTEKQLQAIKHSWSWRVTKPFRDFAMFIRGTVLTLF